MRLLLNGEEGVSQECGVGFFGWECRGGRGGGGEISVRARAVMVTCDGDV